MSSIVINLSPVLGINRKAHFATLVYNKKAKEVVTTWDVICYNDEGEELNHPFYTQYTISLIADNTTYVNPATGEYLPEGEIGMGEFDFYEYIAANQPVIIDSMITGVGQRAASLGRFDKL